MEDYIIKGNHKYFKASCVKCLKDRGYVRKQFINKICGSCAATLRLADPKNNPMYGKKRPDNVKRAFRKNTFDNVNYNDVVIEYSKTGSKLIKYRTTCPVCCIDKGHLLHVDATRLCKKCTDDKRRLYTKEHKRIRCTMKANLTARLKQRLINKNKKSTFDILGYTVDDLKLHLESKWELGMTWDNYGVNGWEIDHVTPDSWFGYNSIEDEDFKKCWSLNNLQPMWAKDNRIKSNNWSG